MSRHVTLHTAVTSYRLPAAFLVPAFIARTSVVVRRSSTSAVPPESPKYIDVPQPPQPQAVRTIYVKGVLPKPRKIISEKGPEKTSEEYLNAVTPEPATRTTPPSTPTSDFQAWKARQAASRRENLRNSLKELTARKVREERYIAKVSAIKRAENKALREAPESDAERFTKATLLSSQTATGLNTANAEYRAAYFAQKKRNYEAHLADTEEQRRNDLHTLYVNAGDFITTEQRMREEVDRVFDDTTQFDDKTKAGLNIWDLAMPETVRQMLRMRGNDEQKAIAKDRMKRMAEELTGGKIREQNDD